jgi:hypothetical protein
VANELSYRAENTRLACCRNQHPFESRGRGLTCKVVLHIRFPWCRDIGALSRNNAEYTIVAYATMYIGRFTTINMDCWRVTLLRCANVSMVTRFVVYGVGLICRAAVFRNRHV